MASLFLFIAILLTPLVLDFQTAAERAFEIAINVNGRGIEDAMVSLLNGERSRNGSDIDALAGEVIGKGRAGAAVGGERELVKTGLVGAMIEVHQWVANDGQTEIPTQYLLWSILRHRVS